MVVDDHDARRLGAHCGRISIVSSTSVPAPGRELIVGRAAVAFHPADDRLPQPATVGGHGGRVEACAAVADEDLRAVRAHLGVDGDRAGAGCELRRVRERLPRRGNQRTARIVEHMVADGDDVDRHRVRVLDLGGRGLDRRGEAVGRARRRAVEQPRPQLALLAPGERRHLARVVGALLHQGERLQHRVVEVRRELGPLLRADPLGALDREVAAQAPEKRREDEAQRHRGDDDRQHHVARLAQHPVGVEEEQRRADDQGDAEAAAVEVREPTAAAARSSARCGPRPARDRPQRATRPARPATRASATGARSAAAPPAARINGQTKASDHQRPSSRRTSRPARVRKQTPAATRQLVTGILATSASTGLTCPGAGSASPSSMKIQART